MTNQLSSNPVLVLCFPLLQDPLKQGDTRSSSEKEGQAVTISNRKILISMQQRQMDLACREQIVNFAKKMAVIQYTALIPHTNIRCMIILYTNIQIQHINWNEISNSEEV